MYLAVESWADIVKRLPVEDKIRCRAVCQQLKIEAEKCLKHQVKLGIRRIGPFNDYNCFHPHHEVCQQVRLQAEWCLKQLIRHGIQKIGPYNDYNCFDPDHKVSTKDSIRLPFHVSLEDANLLQLPNLMPSIKCFKVSEAFFPPSKDNDYSNIIGHLLLGSYFTSVECFVLPGKIHLFLHKDNKQVKHLLVKSLKETDSVRNCFPNLESFEMTDAYDEYNQDYLHPTRRLVIKGSIHDLHCNSLSSTLEAIKAAISFEEYTIHEKPVFPHLTTLRLDSDVALDIRGFTRFMKNQKEVIRELAFDAREYELRKDDFENLTRELSLVETLDVVVDYSDIFEVLVQGIRKHATNVKKLSFSHVWGRDSDLKAEEMLAKLPSGYVSCINGTVDTFGFYGYRDFIDKEEEIAEILSKNILSGNPKTITVEGIRFDHIDGWVNEIQESNPNLIIEKTKLRFYNENVSPYDLSKSKRITPEAEFGDGSNIPPNICLYYRLSVSLKPHEDWVDWEQDEED